MHLVDGGGELEKYQDIISWISTKAFAIYSPKRFEEEVLPNYFGSRGAKTSSFIRKVSLFKKK